MIVVVGIGGTLRPGSTTEQALQLSLAAAAAAGAETVLLAGNDLDLPMYGGDTSHHPARAQRLVEEVRRADGIIVASPGYHGTISGLVKNALDHLEELRDDPRPYLDGRAVGTIACASGWQAAVGTLGALRSIAHSLRGWPTPMGAAVQAMSGSPTEHDGGAQFQLETVGRQVVEFARRWQGD